MIKDSKKMIGLCERNFSRMNVIVWVMLWLYLKVICNIIMILMIFISINLFDFCIIKSLENLKYLKFWDIFFYENMIVFNLFWIILLYNLEIVYFRVVYVCFCKFTFFYLGLIFFWRLVYRNITILSLVLFR